MTSYIAILSLLLVSALLEEAKVTGLQTTPFTCFQCTDCTSPESVTQRTVCSDLLSTNHEPHCTTTSTNDGRVHRGCGEASTARQDGCRQRVDEKTREPEVVCSCGWSECNAPKMKSKFRIKRSAMKDDKEDEIWVPTIRYSKAASITAVVFAVLILTAAVVGTIVSSFMCCRGSPLAVTSRRQQYPRQQLTANDQQAPYPSYPQQPAYNPQAHL